MIFDLKKKYINNVHGKLDIQVNYNSVKLLKKNLIKMYKLWYKTTAKFKKKYVYIISP